ncbi:PAS domain-containing protein [Streptomyces sp. MNP-20]|uniref:PAS domain-containing protein n=1 Tax=Streptomyces sp. MNP-20 TaxID=2721165 RepID=UPI001554D79E|nr:PAS domain-containing protein [Streptomyces sp. MNP-20]
MSSRPSRGAARLAAILDALPDALVLVNANGTVVNANAIALEAFEAPGTALVGRGLLDLLPEFDSRLIPGSMRRPDSTDERGRTKPKRMIARRTDGYEFPVEVTSSSLEDSRNAYDERYGHGGYSGYSGDEMLMIVVRDLSGALNTEAELARSQRQTEMILRAAAEGVVGTDTDGRVVLVNPAAAQILGFRASDLGGQELHPLVLHSRADGEPFPYDESPLADTLRSGRKHRVRGQVLWAKSGEKVAVDLTTAPVRDGDQLVGAVMTFTDRRPYDALAEKHEAALAQHAEELREAAERRAEELAAEQERYAALAEREKDRFEAFAEQEQERYDALDARHRQLVAVLDRSLRGPLDEMRRELAALAADDAGQLWPEANQVLHHLSAGYARMTTLVDNVLGFQRLEAGAEELVRTVVPLDAVVAAGVDGAVELIGPGRAQFAVHAPPVAVHVDAHRLATALAHLIADVAGIDATGNTRAGAVVSGGPEAAAGYVDSTVVVAAAQRGEVVRIEVRGPYTGGDPVHEPVVQGIVRAHGGVLQTHEVPGTGGSAYVLEVPVGDGAVAASAPGAAVEVAPRPAPAVAAGPAQGGDTAGAGAPVPEQAGAPAGGGRRRARRSSVDSFLDSGLPGEAGSGDTAGAGGPGGADSGAGAGVGADTGVRTGAGPGIGPGVAGPAAEAGAGGTGRRRRRAVAHGPAEAVPVAPGDTGAGAPGAPSAFGMSGGSGASGASGGSGDTSGGTSGGTGRRRGRPSPAEGAVMTAAEHAAGSAALGETVPPQGVPSQAVPPQGMPPQGDGGPSGRRARRAGESHALALPSGTGAAPETGDGQGDDPDAPRPGGRRARRALAAARERAAAEEASNSRVFALPPADADREEGSGALIGAEQVTGQDAGPAAGQGARQASGQPVQGGARQLAGARPAGAGQDARGAVATEAGPAQVGASVSVPAGVQAGMQAAARGGVPTQGRAPAPARGAVARGAMPAPAPGGLPAGPGDTRQGDTRQDDTGQHAVAPQDPTDDHTPPQPHPTQSPALPAQAQPQAPTGRRRARQAPPAVGPAGGATPPQGMPGAGTPAAGVPAGAMPVEGTPAGGTPSTALPPQATPQAAQATPQAPHAVPHAGATPAQGAALPPERDPRARAAQPLPAEAAPIDPNSTQGRAISVRTLGQGVPFGRQPQPPVQPQAQPPHGPAQPAQGGSGRRRKLATPPEPGADERPESAARPHPQAPPQPKQQPQPRLSPGTEGTGRSYAIGAPDENAAEGPEPLDGPGGAVEVTNRPQPRPMDDELPPEPLDNPRRLLVWPAPDVTTQQALSDRGYRPVIVHSREEVDAQIAAFPAALFVDPLTGPITRTALQSLRQAAVAAEVPVLVTAGLGQASREAAYGADPAVLLKALAPRDSEQHPPRVLLIEEHEEIALALTATLERRGMQVARAESDADAVTLAAQTRPNLVVMDLHQVRRRRAGIIDWLRANGQLNRTPLVVYTAAVDETDLPKLAAGETVLFLAERSTSSEVQTRIVDLLAKIGTN